MIRKGWINYKSYIFWKSLRICRHRATHQPEFQLRKGPSSVRKDYLWQSRGRTYYFLKTLQSKCHYVLLFLDTRTEAWKEEIICPRSQSRKVVQSGSQPCWFGPIILPLSHYAMLLLPSVPGPAPTPQRKTQQ